MATEYSLLTWAGLGTAVTLSTSTHLITFAAHGAPIGHAFRFSPLTTTMPTIQGVQATVDDVFYVSATSYATGAFRLSFSPDGSTAVTITNVGSGVKIVGNYWASLDTAGQARYGTAGSERVYPTVIAACTAINAMTSNSALDVVVEVYDKVQDMSAGCDWSNKWNSFTLHSKVNGVRTPAYHNGAIGGGWHHYTPGTSRILQTFRNTRSTVDGLEASCDFVASLTNASFYIIGLDGTIQNCIAKNGYGFRTFNWGTRMFNNIAHDCFTYGILLFNGSGPDTSIIAHNTAINCAIGFHGNLSGATCINNLAFGCTADWGTSPNTAYNPYLSNNAGGSASSPWGLNPITTLVAGDFADSTNNDTTPSLLSAHQVGAAVVYPNIIPSDASDNFRPDYFIDTFPDNIATIGALEYLHLDSADGRPPQSQTFTLSGITTNSLVQIIVGSTEIYNAVPVTLPLVVDTTFSTDQAYTLTVRTSATAPFKKTYRESGTYYAVGGQDRTITLIDDIACSSTRASNWSLDTGTGIISHDGIGTTRHTVQELYSYLMNYMQDPTRIELTDHMDGTTSEVFSLVNGGSISDTDMEMLRGGSVEDDTTLWSNVYSVGTQAANTPIYVHLDGVLQTSFWPTGNIDILVKCDAASGHLVDVRAHNYTDTYDHWQMTVGAGRNVAAISTSDDPDNQTLEATVATWNDITVTVDNPTGKQIDASDTPASYTTTINGAGRPIAEVYERLKYITKATSTYVSANSSFAEVKISPYGTLAGGVFLGAQGIWLENVASGDALNYILTDNLGTTHQASAPPVQILVTNIIDGSAIQLYDLTNNIQLAVDVVTGTTYALEKSWAGDLDIRVRLMSQTGVTAYEFFETQGVFSSAGMSLRAGQVADAVYNTNGIDGSLVAGVEIIDGTLRVQVATGSISWQELYAYETYWLSTEAGIVDEGRFAQAVDVANYLWFDFKLKNVTFPSVPLVVTGGYGKDGDTGTSLAMLDTTGGTIILAPDHVVPYSSGAEATVAIVQAGLTAQGFSTTRAPKLDNLDAAVSSASGGLTVEEHRLLEIVAAATGGKVSGAETETITFRDVADTQNVITATVDANGNRTNIVYGI